mmetsp:Transcript_18001/g.33135  ORF Transcript_18001/g.33135 Transcript_18001/m.33135 type:complete len:182 (-) Transcript_18001:166-711(-)
MMVGFSKSVTWMMVAFIMLIVKVGGSKGKAALSTVASGHLQREYDEMIHAVANDTTTADYHSCCQPGTATCCTNPEVARNGKFNSCTRAEQVGCEDCRKVAQSNYTEFGIDNKRWLDIYNRALLEWCGGTKESEIAIARTAKRLQLREEQRERARAAEKRKWERSRQKQKAAKAAQKEKER